MQITINEQQGLKEAEELTNKLEIINVTDQQSLELATSHKNNARKMLQRLDEIRKGMTKPLDDAKKNIMGFFRPFEDKLNHCMDGNKDTIGTYLAEQEKIRREQEEILRKKQEAEAERLRKRAEAVKTESKREELLEKAEEAENIVPVLPEIKTEGTYTKTVWTYEIEDFNLLPNEYKIPNETMIGQVVRSTKGKLIIPGVKIFSKQTVV